MLVPHADRERRRALIQPSPVGDPPKPHVGDRRDPREEAIGERLLVGGDRVVGGRQPRPPSGPRGAGDPGQVLHRSHESGKALVVLGAGLPPLRRFVGRRDELVRRPRLEQGPASGEDAEMWSEELVGRTDEEVGVESVQIEETMLRQMHRIDRDDGADLLGARHEVGRRRDRPHGVGRERERDELRSR